MAKSLLRTPHLLAGIKSLSLSRVQEIGNNEVDVSAQLISQCPLLEYLSLSTPPADEDDHTSDYAALPPGSLINLNTFIGFPPHLQLLQHVTSLRELELECREYSDREIFTYFENFRCPLHNLQSLSLSVSRFTYALAGLLGRLVPNLEWLHLTICAHGDEDGINELLANGKCKVSLVSRLHLRLI